VPSDEFDVVLIGCGPGGSSAATFLAQENKRVLALEKEIFPRFHIGESLLPSNNSIFREMGVFPKLQQAGFLRKVGAIFDLSNGSLSTRIVFGQGSFNRETEAFHVERAKLDHILLQHARDSGADVREGWTVQRFTTDESGVNVEARSPENQVHSFRSKFLIDASGRGNFTGNVEGLRVIHPRHKKVAIFGHFADVQLPPMAERLDTIIVRLSNKWFWIIPLSVEKTSVGLVIDQDELNRSKSSPEDVFYHWVNHSEVVKERMQAARPTLPIQTLSDFSYYNRRLVGDRLLRVGDAAGFMDPIFSAGVLLAMWSGKLAALTLIESLRRGTASGRPFASYERRVRRGLKFYWRIVENYYTWPFMELFLRPPPPGQRLDISSAIIGALSGEIEGSWAMRWRIELFFWLVKIQSLWPMAPRIPLLN
jgi:FADH2-dependent halogenase